MPADDEIDEVLADLAAAMRESDIRWYLFGAQAAAVWGRPRFSGDVDVTVMMPHSNVRALVRVMRGHGMALRFDDDEFIEKSRVLPFIHTRTDFPIDVVLAGPGLEEEFLNRAAMVEVEGTLLPVISPEDLIITKVLAGRYKDIDDVRGILRERADSMDLTRIRTKLRFLEEALTRGDLISVFENELAKIAED